LNFDNILYLFYMMI